MAAVMPQTMPWIVPVRGSSDGVKDRHPAMSAPQQPGSVTYSSFRCLARSGGGSVISGAAGGGKVASAVSGEVPPPATGPGMSGVTAASGSLSEGSDEDRLDGVQAVLGLVEDDTSAGA